MKWEIPNSSGSLSTILNTPNEAPLTIYKNSSTCPKPSDEEVNRLIQKNFEEFIYLDNNANHPLFQSVIEKINFVFKKTGNPASLHEAGKVVRSFIEHSREVVAELLYLKKDNVIFTSSGTETNNLIIKGAAFKELLNGTKRHMITSTIEHKSVLNSFEFLKNFGFMVDYVKPNKNTNCIEVEDILPLLKEDTFFVSIMSVNNETGLINNIKKIADKMKEKNILFHSDASQHIGKTKLLDFSFLDFATFSPHKFGGPIGTSFMYIKDKNSIISLLDGGAQEYTIRPGTVNTPLISGAAKALLEISKIDLEKISELKFYLERELTDRSIKINFVNSNRNCSTISATWPIQADRVLSFMSENNVFFSAGSACSSKDKKPSYVLREMGFTEEQANRTTRISLSSLTTKKEIDIFIDLVDKFLIMEQVC